MLDFFPQYVMNPIPYVALGDYKILDEDKAAGLLQVKDQLLKLDLPQGIVGCPGMVVNGEPLFDQIGTEALLIREGGHEILVNIRVLLGETVAILNAVTDLLAPLMGQAGGPP